MQVVLAIVDKPSANGFIYPKEEMMKAVAEYTSRNKEIYVENRIGRDLSSGPGLAIEHIIGVVDDISFEGDQVIGEVQFLDRPNYLFPGFDPERHRVTPHGFGSISREGIVEQYSLASFGLISKL